MSDASLTGSALSRSIARDLPATELGSEHRLQAGMVCFLCSEAAFFATLIVAYITYLGQSESGPTPADVLRLPIVIGGTIALVASSFTVHFAAAALRTGRNARFHLLLAATIALGILFLGGTALEWRGLVFDSGLTIGTNLFGTTYFTLVGFHAAHVTGGVLLLSLMFALSLSGFISQRNNVGFEVVSWYWHFVDSVWIVVFGVVYVFGR